MGSFSYTCSVSRLPIHAGDDVRIMLVSSSPYDEPPYCTMNAGYFPRTFPIKAKYNDYGSVEDVEEGIGRDLWLEGLKVDLLSVGVGENTYHDVPTSKDMSFDDLLQALVCDRVRVRSDVGDTPPSKWRKQLGIKTPEGVPTMQRVKEVLEANNVTRNFLVDKIRYGQVRVRWDGLSAEYGKDVERLSEIQPLFGEYATVVAAGRGLNKADLLIFPKPGTKDYHGPGRSFKKQPLRVVQSMIREDVWQALLSIPSEIDFGRNRVGVDFHIKNAVTLYEEFVKRVKDGTKYFYDLRDLRDNPVSWYIKDEVPFTVGQGTHWDMLVHKCLPVDEVNHVIQSVAEFVHARSVLSNIRFVWRAGDSVGPQYGDWKAHKDFHEKMMEISAKEKALEEERCA